jgi:hypothetical protein
VNDDQSEPLPSPEALDEWEVAADEHELPDDGAT